MGNVCILLSTCERYRSMAEFTVRQLQKFWPDHPPLFSCGLNDLLEDTRPLPLRDPVEDWMAVTLSACRDLRQKGFRQAYVILDDHPPLARCHSEHLNVTIPAMMEALDAVSIALSGYGQRRRVFGQIVRWRQWEVDRVPAEQLWKFPLHPALWNLETLQVILEFLVAALPPSEHTPWAFERKGGDPHSSLPAKLKENSYRLCGVRMTARGMRVLRHLPLRLAQFAADVLRFGARVLGGAEARSRMDQACRWLDCPYDGPYPLFWSGLVAKGKINTHLVSYLRATGQSQLLNEIKSAAAIQ